MKSLSLSQPHVIIMVGIPGSGKSFFAEKFAETFRAPYVSQAKITALVGTNIRSTDLLHYQLDELLKTNQSIIVEGACDTRTERSELAAKARACGYETMLLWVQTDPTTARQRSTKDRTGPMMSPDEYDDRIKRFVPPGPIEKPTVISGKHTYATQAKVVLKKLSAPRADSAAQVTPPARTAKQPHARRNITVR